MKKCYVVGNPISHSLSPKVFNYLFEQNNINACYSKFNAKNENEFLEFIEKKDFYGLNITLPYKKNAYDIVIDSNNSLTINSINCIKNKTVLMKTNYLHNAIFDLDNWPEHAEYRITFNIFLNENTKELRGDKYLYNEIMLISNYVINVEAIKQILINLFVQNFFFFE